MVGQLEPINQTFIGYLILKDSLSLPRAAFGPEECCKEVMDRLIKSSSQEFGSREFSRLGRGLNSRFNRGETIGVAWTKGTKGWKFKKFHSKKGREFQNSRGRIFC